MTSGPCEQFSVSQKRSAGSRQGPFAGWRIEPTSHNKQNSMILGIGAGEVLHGMERMNLPVQLSPMLLFIQVSSYFLSYLSWIYFQKCLKVTVEVSSKNESFGTGVRAGNTLESI